MRQLTYVEPGKLQWRDVPEPTIDAPGQAIVRPLAVATCDLDAGLVRGRAPVPGPFAFGHEVVAEVVAVGAGVRTARPGDRVVVPFQITCGACDACRRGHGAVCSGVEPRRAMYGLGAIARKDWGGAMSDRMLVPYADAMLVPLPPGIDPAAVASCSDNIADAWRTIVPPLEQRPGASVLIVGGGAPSIGLYAVAIARAVGAEVHYIDAEPHRAALARELGAEVVEGPPPNRHGRHLVTVDASAAKDGLHCAIASTAGEGICTSVGIYWGGEVGLPLFQMYSNNITFVTGRVSSRAVIPRVLDLVVSGRLHPERVTTAVVGWSKALDALARPFTKLVMVPD